MYLLPNFDSFRVFFSFSPGYYRLQARLTTAVTSSFYELLLQPVSVCCQLYCLIKSIGRYLFLYVCPPPLGYPRPLFQCGSDLFVCFVSVPQLKLRGSPNVG